MSAYDLLGALRDEGLRAPPQIYRALKWLGGKGLVHKLESTNAYIACSHLACCGGEHQHDASTVFFLCDTCGAVKERSGADLADVLGELADELGFDARQTAVEVRGECRVCRSS